MVELSYKEIEILDFLLEFVNMGIFSIEQQERDSGKLDYSLCSDDAEKQIITQKKVKKFKKRISKSNPKIAGYLNALTTPDPLNLDLIEKLELITKNFLLTEYHELFEVLVDKDLNELNRYDFDSEIESLGFKYKPLKDFIQGVCDINSFHTYKSFLDIPQNSTLSYEKAKDNLNNAFYRLEAFMNGNVNQYSHFDFNTAFTELFYLNRKVENYTYDNCKRIGKYWTLTEQIRIDYDKSNFKNQNAYDNKAFCNDCDVITSIAWDRIDEFISFQTQDEIEEQNKKLSIADVIKSSQKNEKIKEVIETSKDETPKEETNPYPKIFKNHNAYSIFKKLVEEFGNTKENLSNYSFVFHKMTYEDLIHFDLKQQSYFTFLDDFDITISRIKPLQSIGKITYRESIYLKAK